MNKTIQMTRIGELNYNGIRDKKYNIIANQGSARSSKTYNIMIVLIALAMQLQKLEISVVAETMPHLKKGAMKDFMDIMQGNNLYNERQHNRSDHIYRFDNRSYIEFFSAENDEKVRGPGRDILFANECNLLKRAVFIMLQIRTRQKTILDYNPADEFHWIYDDILPQPDTLFIHSTYKDNPFLPDYQIKNIEKLKDIDENYWRVFGLGERGVGQEIIYKNYDIVDKSKIPEHFDFKIYGLDFGYNNPSALVEIGYIDKIPYVTEKLYQTGLTNIELIEKIKSLNIEKIKEFPIYADCAEPARIKEFKQHGFWIVEADKSVKDGIDEVKRHKLQIGKSSTNFIKEIRSYKYKVKNDIVDDNEPVKFGDHLMDGTRYAIYTHWKQKRVSNIGVKVRMKTKRFDPYKKRRW
jgi:phage terminase large subunit